MNKTDMRVSLDRLRAAAAAGGPRSIAALTKRDRMIAELAESSAPEVTAAVERLAKSLAQLEPDEPWPTNAELGGSLTGTRDDEFRDGKRDEASELLADLLDVEDMAQELHRLFGYDMPWANLTRVEKAYYHDKAADLRAALLGADQ